MPGVLLALEKLRDAPAGPDGRPRRAPLSTARLETFADGVFAIAATLLILNVEVPELGEHSLAHELVRLWPAYVGYAVSFLTIGIIWVNHHTVLQQLRGIDRTFLFINVFFLLCIAFIPFPTRLLATYVRTDNGEAPPRSRTASRSR